MTTIFAATDFSEPADLATQQAALIARHLGAELSLVFATNLAGAQPDAFEVSQGKLEPFREMLVQEIEQARRRLEARSSDLRASGVASKVVIADGTPAEALTDLVANAADPLVVIGTHGRVGYERIFLGSVTEAVLRECPADVLVAREPVREGGFQRVMVATDFTASADRALARAIELSAPGATIDLVHAWKIAGPLADFLGRVTQSSTYAHIADAVIADADHKGEQRVAANADCGREISFHSVGGSANGVIHDRLTAANPRYDLVAVGSHDDSKTHRWLVGSVAAATARHATSSVLVARPPAA